MTDDIKQKAVSLRQQGMTYPQIAKELDDQLSVHWLRRNLSKVPKGVYIDELMQELIDEASKPEGCTNYKAMGIIFKHKGERVSYDVAKGLKTKAKKIKPKCLFIPAWVDTDKPAESHVLLNEISHEVYEFLSYAVTRYMEEYPNTSKYSVMREVVGMAYSESLPEPMTKRLERNSLIVEQLCCRKNGDYTTHSKPTGNKCVGDWMTDMHRALDLDTIPDDELDDIWKVGTSQ